MQAAVLEALGDGVGAWAVLEAQAALVSSDSRIAATLEDRVTLEGGVFVGSGLDFF